MAFAGCHGAHRAAVRSNHLEHPCSASHARAEIVETVELAKGVSMDVDGAGQVVGIEILNGLSRLTCPVHAWS
ncbi:MAG: DUF2283 domain-containing protein, partial [Thermomicrobiales bacterium]